MRTKFLCMASLSPLVRIVLCAGSVASFLPGLPPLTLTRGSPLLRRGGNGGGAEGASTVVRRAQTYVSEAEFSRLVADAVKTNWGEEGTARVLGAWKRLTDGEEHEGKVTHGDSNHELMVQRCSSFVEGLELKPFHDAQEHSWCRALEAEWTTVRDELKSRLDGDEPDAELAAKGNNVWAGAKNATSAVLLTWGKGGGWSGMVQFIIFFHYSCSCSYSYSHI